MKVPKFSSVVTIPVLFFLNLLAWLYIYDEYMMSWVVVYPIFMVLVIAFTITAEVAFGKSKRYKYIGINVCLVLLLLVLSQRFIPMDKLEQGLKDNYYAHIAADVSLSPGDRAIRDNGVAIVAKDYQDTANTVEKLQVYKDGQLIDEITLGEAIEKVEEIMDSQNIGEFTEIKFSEPRYVGIKQKGGTLRLNFMQDYVFFKYNLTANDKGFIWAQENYNFAGLEMPRKQMVFGETNEKFKKILLKGDVKQLVTVECIVDTDPKEVGTDLQTKGYEIIAEDPVTVQLPFYQIANLAHEDYIEELVIK